MLNLRESELKYKHYIIRGFIDGDGWIRKDGKEFFVCGASFDFMIFLKEYFEEIGMINIKIINQGDNFYLIRSAIQSNVLLLKKCVYNNGESMGLQRKRNRLFYIQERCSETIIG